MVCVCKGGVEKKRIFFKSNGFRGIEFLPTEILIGLRSDIGNVELEETFRIERPSFQRVIHTIVLLLFC